MKDCILYLFDYLSRKNKMLFCFVFVTLKIITVLNTISVAKRYNKYNKYNKWQKNIQYDTIIQT